MDVRRVNGGAAAAAGTWDEHATRYAGQERFEARAIAAALRLADPRPQDRVIDLAMIAILSTASPSRIGQVTAPGAVDRLRSGLIASDPHKAESIRQHRTPTLDVRCTVWGRGGSDVTCPWS